MHERGLAIALLVMPGLERLEEWRLTHTKPVTVSAITATSPICFGSICTQQVVVDSPTESSRQELPREALAGRHRRS